MSGGRQSRPGGFGRFLRSRRGAVSAVMALMLVPLVGCLGLVAEASTWYLVQRAAQNAADSAAIAAARNNCASGQPCQTVGLKPTFNSEARSVATQFGFTNGANNSTVVAANGVACPDGTNTCFSVTVTHRSALYLLKLVGYNGDTTTSGGAAAQTVAAQALAQRQAGTGYCITAYGTATNSIEFKGGGSLDLTGCDISVPNGGASCNAHTGDTIRYADVGLAGDNKNCGTEQLATVASVDNYQSLASNLPNPDTACPGANFNARYPQAPRNGGSKDAVTKAANRLSGSLAFALNAPKCGDVKLINNVTVTGNSILLIENGRLDLAGFTLNVASSASLTIIFGGTNPGGGNNPDHFVMSSVNNGVIDYSAPSTGTWSGVAIYQDPVLTSGINMKVAGSNPEFNITGLIYAPGADIEIAGAIDHATAGEACLAFMTKTLQINGTTSIFAYPTRDCDRAGLTGLNKVIDKVALVK